MKANESWEKWKAENETARDPSTLGAMPRQREYLENRLHAAFMSGFLRGEEQGTELAAKRIADVARGKR